MILVYEEYAVYTKDLSVYLGENLVLDNVSFVLKHPSALIVMGPNGAGKTTLLRTILGMIKRRSGVLKVFGYDPEKDQDQIRRLVSYMPQISNVYQYIPLKVKEIVASPHILKVSEDPDQVERAIQITGLEEYLDKYFYELSGGYKQRVLIARALAMKAKLLVFDEPLSMVDASAREHIVDLLFDLLNKKEVSMIVVSHDISRCLRYDPDILFLNRRVLAYGKAREVLKPEVLEKVYGLATLNGKTIYLGEEHGPYH